MTSTYNSSQTMVRMGQALMYMKEARKEKRNIDPLHVKKLFSLTRSQAVQIGLMPKAPSQAELLKMKAAMAQRVAAMITAKREFRKAHNGRAKV